MATFSGKKKDYKKSKNPNKIKTVKLRPKDEWIEAKGKHEPLISEITWKKAQNILKKMVMSAMVIK